LIRFLIAEAANKKLSISFKAWAKLRPGATELPRRKFASATF